MRKILSLGGSCDLELGIIRRVGQAGASSMISRPFPGKSDPETLLKWARFENARNAANVYIRPIAKAPHPWLFLDDISSSLGAAIGKKYAVIVVETSPNNCQLRILAARNLDDHERFIIQRALVMLLGPSRADLGSVSGDKWGRLPGFQNRKPGREGAWTNLIIDTVFQAQRYNPDPLLHQQSFARPSIPSVNSGLNEFSKFAFIAPGEGGFRNEFAFACHQLRLGHGDDEIIRSVAAHAYSRGKRKTAEEAERYARKTLAAARSRLRISFKSESFAQTKTQ